MKHEDLLFDPSLNILHRANHQFDPFFHPKNVAVIGASERKGSVGRTVIWNLLQSPFGGTVFPINPKRSNILGIKAYPSVQDLPEPVDLAVIVTPAKTVPNLVQQCVDAKIPACVIISAGFKELGKPGENLETEIQKIASRGKIRIIGPNCLGVMCPTSGLNATFAASMGLKGNLAFISQSGALCTAVLDWSLREKVGFSAFVSIGSMLDVDWGDLIHYLGSDPHTESILMYMESIGDSRSFLSAAREVALTKPIILIKAGKSEESAKAAVSHTGALSGSDDVLNAALRRVGILRVDTIADLFGMASVLAKQPSPKGPNLTIVTNAGGPGVIATDALIENYGKLAELSKKTHQKLNALLPEHWSRNNPVDILGDASPEVYAKSIEIVAEDAKSDGILVVLTPQDMTDPTESAKALQPYGKLEKPILASWMGAGSIEKGNKILNQASIPTFGYPDQAAKAFAYMWRYSYNLMGIYEIPSFIASETKALKEVSSMIQKARKEKRYLLTEYESKHVLKLYDIPTIETLVATDAKQAVKHAEKIGFPVVLKLHSYTITHKTDVGGVKLNLSHKEDVTQAFEEIRKSCCKLKGEKYFQGVTVQPMIKLEGYEVILGSTVDPQFGPTLLFGMGGQLVEVFKDRALALPPLTTTLAKRMMEQTKIFQALKGVRGQKSADIEALQKLLVRFSMMIVEQPWIKECDLNPLIVSPKGIHALDARIVIHDEKNEADLPKTAIRPYPVEYIEEWKLQNKQRVLIRPIRPDDEPLIVKFHQKLSEETVLQRYLKQLHYDQLITHKRLLRICFNDYDREIALVVETEHPRQIIGVSRLSKIVGTTDARFAIILQDDWQNQGLGTKLLEKIVHIAQIENIQRLVAEMLPENKQMIAICKKHQFEMDENKEKGLILAMRVL